jgi:hypothetical protein
VRRTIPPKGGTMTAFSEGFASGIARRHAPKLARIQTSGVKSNNLSVFSPSLLLVCKLSAAVHDCSRKSCTAAESLHCNHGRDFLRLWGDPLPFACLFACRHRRSFAVTAESAKPGVSLPVTPGFCGVYLSGFVSSARRRQMCLSRQLRAYSR